ncbi:TetR/AcrR family transcriptional regulator, partial [Saccharothrix sp. Mg75]|uniref:TetR/AcrR family transcriptional regulator n=1 Tax=Saccharothrix sp. Mg75 TaxID=3445357 RepID=UPI003EEDCCAE
MRRSAAETREHVLSVTHELFYWHGIHAVGVDRVAAEAGVAPTTLYRLFRSKDELVAAYVERADTSYRAWFSEATKADGRGARERVLAAFDELIVQVHPSRCRGCPFLMALAEFPDPELPAHRKAVATKEWMRARFGELTGQLEGVVEPGALADKLALVMEGVYASVQALGVDGPARSARELVELILPVPAAGE